MGSRWNGFAALCLLAAVGCAGEELTETYSQGDGALVVPAGAQQAMEWGIEGPDGLRLNLVGGVLASLRANGSVGAQSQDGLLWVAADVTVPAACYERRGLEILWQEEGEDEILRGAVSATELRGFVASLLDCALGDSDGGLAEAVAQPDLPNDGASFGFMIPICGNGIVEAGEECDTPNGSGMLCTSDCRFPR